jgi:hypothetical protein
MALLTPRAHDQPLLGLNLKTAVQFSAQMMHAVFFHSCSLCLPSFALSIACRDYMLPIGKLRSLATDLSIHPCVRNRTPT